VRPEGLGKLEKKIHLIATPYSLYKSIDVSGGAYRICLHDVKVIAFLFPAYFILVSCLASLSSLKMGAACSSTRGADLQKIELLTLYKVQLCKYANTNACPEIIRAMKRKHLNRRWICCQIDDV
jgi:hypothetical protein